MRAHKGWGLTLPLLIPTKQYNYIIYIIINNIQIKLRVRKGWDLTIYYVLLEQDNHISMATGIKRNMKCSKITKVCISNSHIHLYLGIKAVVQLVLRSLARNPFAHQGLKFKSHPLCYPGNMCALMYVSLRNSPCSSKLSNHLAGGQSSKGRAGKGYPRSIDIQFYFK